MSELAAFELESANDTGTGTILVLAFICPIEDTTIRRPLGLTADELRPASSVTSTLPHVVKRDQTRSRLDP